MEKQINVDCYRKTQNYRKKICSLINSLIKPKSTGNVFRNYKSKKKKSFAKLHCIKAHIIDLQGPYRLKHHFFDESACLLEITINKKR